ncbi:MAG TPA: hypothetical protein VGI10_23995 [Polyangiaceae bacterium]|jgi:hypothetical protein
MRRNLCQWLVACGLVLSPAFARAEDEPKPYLECTKQPTDNEVGAAKGAFQAGSASFDEADYPRAITYWEDAYRRDCTANALLKNLARAYELNGQKRHAVVALETFQMREPTSAEHEQIQRRIEAMKRQIEAEKATPVPVTQPPPPVQAPTTTPPVGGTPAPTSEPQGKRPVLPLIVAGAGGVVFLVGLAGYSKASKDVSDFEKVCPNRQCGQPGVSDAVKNQRIQQGNDARNRQITYGAVTWVGLAGAAGGVIWYFVSPRKPASSAELTPSRPIVTPAAAPGYAGLSLSGSF